MKKIYQAIEYDKDNPLPEKHAEIINLSRDFAAGIMQNLVESGRDAPDELQADWASVVANTLLRCVDILVKLAPADHQHETMQGFIETLTTMHNKRKC